MSKPLSAVFEEVRKATQLVEVDGDYIPTAGGKVSHLFVNGICPAGFVVENPAVLLSKCRGIAEVGLEILASQCSSSDIESACFSIYDIPSPGANVRVYRTRVEAKNLSLIAKSEFLALVCGEDSQIPEIRRLL